MLSGLAHPSLVPVETSLSLSLGPLFLELLGYLRHHVSLTLGLGAGACVCVTFPAPSGTDQTVASGSYFRSDT
jgi:hypothetical protein